MKTLYIGFSRPQHLKFPIYSWIIMWLYKTPYSHTYARFVRKSGTQFIYESVGVGTRFVSVHIWKEHAVVYKEFAVEVTAEQYDNIIDICINSLGTGYSKSQPLGIGLAKLAARLGFKMKSPVKDSKHEICSEAIARVLGLPSDERDTVSPEDIYNYLESKT